MCYIDKSIEQLTSTCAMCRVFPPRRDHPPNFEITRCPHKDNMGVCKNRVHHPRHDVIYFRNAELTSFNGCGYCKWAKCNPKILASTESAWKNPGWPGCCRPPKANEYKYINAADWYAITKIHGVIAPVPPPRTVKSVSMPVTTPSSSLERWNPGPRRVSDVPQTVTVATASPTHSSQTTTTTTTTTTTATGTRPPPNVTRETTIITLSPKSLSSAKPTLSSCLASSTSPSSPSSPSSSSSPICSTLSPTERRVTTKTFSVNESPFATIRGPPLNFNNCTSANPPPNPNTLRPSILIPKLSASISSSSSSHSPSSGSVTQSETVTSEGFTDYLSDESEAEMQREAERRAHEAEFMARLQRTKLELGREEEEFRAARNQLANVGLQPPPAWSSGKLANASPSKEQSSSPPPPATTLTSPPTTTTTSRPSRSTSMYNNTPMVQVYTAVRQ